jgi:hypothetical protein
MLGQKQLAMSNLASHNKHDDNVTNWDLMLNVI